MFLYQKHFAPNFLRFVLTVNFYKTISLNIWLHPSSKFWISSKSTHLVDDCKDLSAERELLLFLNRLTSKLSGKLKLGFGSTCDDFFQKSKVPAIELGNHREHVDIDRVSPEVQKQIKWFWASNSLSTGQFYSREWIRTTCKCSKALMLSPHSCKSEETSNSAG